MILHRSQIVAPQNRIQTRRCLRQIVRRYMRIPLHHGHGLPPTQVLQQVGHGGPIQGNPEIVVVLYLGRLQVAHSSFRFFKEPDFGNVVQPFPVVAGTTQYRSSSARTLSITSRVISSRFKSPRFSRALYYFSVDCDLGPTHAWNLCVCRVTLLRSQQAFPQCGQMISFISTMGGH